MADCERHRSHPPYSRSSLRSPFRKRSEEHVIRHTSHVTRQKSHVTRQKSHVTRHTSNLFSKSKPAPRIFSSVTRPYCIGRFSSGFRFKQSPYTKRVNTGIILSYFITPNLLYCGPCSVQGACIDDLCVNRSVGKEHLQIVTVLNLVYA